MHRLTIISPEAEQYAGLIEQAGLTGLEISAFTEPDAARTQVRQSDLLMGLPASLAAVLHEAPPAAMDTVNLSWR